MHRCVFLRADTHAVAAADTGIQSRHLAANLTYIGAFVGTTLTREEPIEAATPYEEDDWNPACLTVVYNPPSVPAPASSAWIGSTPEPMLFGALEPLLHLVVVDHRGSVGMLDFRHHPLYGQCSIGGYRKRAGGVARRSTLHGRTAI